MLISFEGIINKLSKETAPYTTRVFFTPVSHNGKRNNARSYA